VALGHPPTAAGKGGALYFLVNFYYFDLDDDSSLAMHAREYIRKIRVAEALFIRC
jgi:hypothetical protein